MPTSVAGVGNLPSEDLVSLLHAMGIETGIDPQAAVAASRDIAAMLGIEPRSHAAQVGTREELLQQGRSNPRHHPA
jgi:hydroxymethylglutaryl-CoA lyase